MSAEKDYTLEVLAAVTAGDAYLSADATAVFLGMFTPAGKPNRRGFLERIACRPDFPAGVTLGAQTVWRKSKVDEWMTEQERIASRAA